jgi:endonuclease/exonuclease/phosphatase family metal-dependent hydrolase
MKRTTLGFIAFNGILLCVVVFFKPPRSNSERRFTIATFNVQNLFDTQKDPLKDDSTFLPLALKKNPAHRRHCYSISKPKWRRECLELDWTEERLDQKLREIARVVKVINRGKGPDLLFLQEVENSYVLERLIKEHLSELNYQGFLIEGPDPRGVDVAVLSKLPFFARPRLIEIPYTNRFFRSQARGLLEIKLQIGNAQILRALGLHLPSGNAPASWREEALEFINSYVERFPEDLWIVAGDFNISKHESIKRRSLERFALPQWQVSHLEGCARCRGGTFFGGEASFLDMIWLKRGAHGWRIDPASVNTIASSDSDHDALSLDIVRDSGF